MEYGDLEAEPSVEMIQPSVGTGDKVNPCTHRFPHSIVWTPLPIITWLFPLIGHVGITNSKGVIYDFAGPYFICEDDMAFGWPTRYIQLNMESVGGSQAWDRGVYEANTEYKSRVHNLLCDNCHSHVAYALNQMNYRGKTTWNMYTVGLIIGSQGRFVGCLAFLKSCAPFLVLLGIVTTICCLV